MYFLTCASEFILFIWCVRAQDVVHTTCCVVLKYIFHCKVLAFVACGEFATYIKVHI